MNKQQSIEDIIKIARTAAPMTPPSWLALPLASPKEREAMSSATKKSLRRRIKGYALKMQNAWRCFSLVILLPACAKSAGQVRG